MENNVFVLPYYSKIFIVMDYIYLYNCSPIGQFYSNFKISQNNPLL